MEKDSVESVKLVSVFLHVVGCEAVFEVTLLELVGSHTQSEVLLLPIGIVEENTLQLLWFRPVKDGKEKVLLGIAMIPIFIDLIIRPFCVFFTEVT